MPEEEAVEILADRFQILLMPGRPFGAPQHLRLSYGSIPPAAAVGAQQQLGRGLQHILALAAERRTASQDHPSDDNRTTLPNKKPTNN